MKWIISLLLISVFTVNVQAVCTDKLYQIDFTYENENIIMKNIQQIVGCSPTSESLTGYTYEIVSDSHEKLRTYKFGNPGKIYTDTSIGGMSGDVVKPEIVDFSLLIPVIKNSEKLEIYNQNNEKITEFTLPEFNIKSFSPGQNVRISIITNPQGFFDKGFIYLDQELNQIINFNCNYMCDRDMVLQYRIPDSWSGEYTIMIYDYTKKSWRSTNFLVGEQKDNEITIDLR